MTLSHRKAWRALLASESLHAVILEDDVHLGRGFREILTLDWDAFGFDAVKLETMLYKVWVSRRGEPAGERRLHRLGAEHLGAAAYVISRAGARKMLAATRGFRHSVDWTLFGRQTIGHGFIKAFQLVPAIAVQDNLLPDAKSRLGWAPLCTKRTASASSNRSNAKNRAEWRDGGARRVAWPIRSAVG